MHERMQPSRKGSVFASGGVVALLLICGAAKAFGQAAPPDEETPTARPDQGEPPTETGSQRPPLVQPAPAPTPPPPPLPPPPPTTSGTAEFPFGTVPKGPVPAASPPAMPNIDYGGRLRSALRF